MSLVYKINAKINEEQVSDLFKRSGINRPVNDLQRIKKMIDNANLTITVWNRENLIGIARALTDFCYCCYLSDLAVDKKFQKKGIGKELLNRIKKEISKDSMLLLLSAPSAMSYYPKINFKKVENGFIIDRA